MDPAHIVRFHHPAGMRPLPRSEPTDNPSPPALEVAQTGQAPGARCLRERVRRHYVRAALSFATGAFLGTAVGDAAIFGLDKQGYSHGEAVRWGVVAGAATVVAASALSWWVLGRVSCVYVPADEAGP